MNRIEELIDKYCPNGIKEVQLESIVDYLQPTKYIVNNDNYDSTCGIPVLTAGKSFILGYTDEKNNVFNAKQDNIILFDDFTCAIQWVDFDFKVKSSATKFLLSKDQSICNLKYVFYWMKNQNIDENTLEHKRHCIQDFSKGMIPLPPIEIQNEIVHILDTFTELKHRKIQYQYYLDNIFLCLSNPGSKECNTKFSKLIKQLCPNGVEFVKLKDIGYFYSGLKSKTKDDFINGNVKFIAYKDIFKNLKLYYDDLNYKVSIKDNENQNYVQKFDVLFTGSSETLEECAYCSVYLSNEPVLLNSFSFGYRLNNQKINPVYLVYLLFSGNYRKELMKCSKGVTRINVSKKGVENILIPLPSLEIQNEIVNILDQFNDLTNSIFLGLPKEIELRRQQYEYYRNKLLTFKQLEK